jgi:hypothetical protein
MTREDIIRMAREAASEDNSTDRRDGRNVVLYAAKTKRFLERFAALVATAEREACAALLEANGMRCGEESLSRLILETNAAAIRARTP